MEESIRTLSDFELNNLKKIIKATQKKKDLHLPTDLHDSLKPEMEQWWKNMEAIKKKINDYEKNVGPIGPKDGLCFSLNETGPVIIDTSDDYIVLW